MATKMNVQNAAVNSAVSESAESTPTLESARNGLLATWLQANDNRLGFLVQVKNTLETRFLESKNAHIVYRYTKVGHWKQNDSTLWTVYDVFSHPYNREENEESIGKRHYEYSFMVRNSDSATVLCSRRISPRGNGFSGSKESQSNRRFTVKTPRGNIVEYVYAKLWGMRDDKFLRGDLTSVCSWLNIPQNLTDIESANAVKAKFGLYRIATTQELTYDESLKGNKRQAEEVYEEDGLDSLDDYLG